MRDNNFIPLYACTQANEKLIPNPDSEDPTPDYVTFDRKLIERAIVIHKDRIRKATNDLEGDRQAWTDNFKASNLIVWDQIFRMLGETDVWKHSKETQRLLNVRKAYRNILMSLFEDIIIFSWFERQKKQISVLKY